MSQVKRLERTDGELRGERLDDGGEGLEDGRVFWGLEPDDAEVAARETLRGQVARLEGELSRLVAKGFPHLIADNDVFHGRSPRLHAPHLLDLAELERTRDRLATLVADAERRLAERVAAQHKARELLRRAKEDPRRYKFLRIPVVDLGEGSCGTWEVRPRLGPIGMVAGWWQVKLSSGCP